MSAIYHIRIKKEYATAIIDYLQKKDALEIVPEEEAFDIPDWQKEEVRRRIAQYKNNPDSLIGEDEFFAMLNED